MPIVRLRMPKKMMQATLHQAFMAPFEVVIERAKAKGELPTDRTTPDVVAALVGPLFYRRWFSKERIDNRFIGAVIGIAL